MYILYLIYICFSFKTNILSIVTINEMDIVEINILSIVTINERNIVEINILSIVTINEI